MEGAPVLVNIDISETTRKNLGAYYTDPAVAAFLTRWAVTSANDIVLDPSSGDGVFLHEAACRIRALGGDPTQRVYGIDIEEGAHRAFALRNLSDSLLSRLIRRNFFEVDTEELPAVDAVVGNPPFIRYQRFNGDMRQLALRRAAAAGAKLSQLTSSWAPFLIYAAEFIRPGGRLGMVAPAEIAYAGYARQVLRYLRRAFRSVRILTFARKLFPGLSEDTVLILASGRGEPFESLRVVDLPAPSVLWHFKDPESDLPPGVEVEVAAVLEGQERMLQYLLPQSTRDLYRQLKESPAVALLGELADVGIGYVTGHNDFFHVNGRTILRSGLPPDYLRRAVRSGSDLAGLQFTREDWGRLHREGAANHLLHIGESQTLVDPVQAYLMEGARKGVPDRYKCRVRQPWYCVPHVYEGDAFLTYMSNVEPRLVANEAAAVAPNTLHVLKLHPSPHREIPLGALGLAALWQTSLTALSCELEGHSLGGGMLKLEPTEAGRVAVATCDLGQGNLAELASDLDHLLREGKLDLAREMADAMILRRGLGLSTADVEELRAGLLTLRDRRLNR